MTLQSGREGRPGPRGREIAAAGLIVTGAGTELEQIASIVNRLDNSPQQAPGARVFAGGDAVSGASSVVEAIAAGERAAVGIDDEAPLARSFGDGHPERFQEGVVVVGSDSGEVPIDEVPIEVDADLVAPLAAYFRLRASRR